MTAERAGGLEALSWGTRRGRVVPAVPDGGCDLTAHVALDACAAAAQGDVDATLLSTQREALQALGVSAALPAERAGRARPSDVRRRPAASPVRRASSPTPTGGGRSAGSSS